jgi:hypothetical protein
VDDQRVVTVDSEHANLERVAVARRAGAHREALIEVAVRNRVANCVKHVLIGDAVLAGRRDDPCHPVKVRCRARRVKESCQ